MFKSYKSINRRIIDDDFIAPMPARLLTPEGYHIFSISANLGYAVIRVYTDKGLPVLPNLIRALLYRHSICSFGLNNIIDRNKRLNPLYASYADEIDKLLVLV
jgi:hypothetical protein